MLDREPLGQRRGVPRGRDVTEAREPVLWAHAGGRAGTKRGKDVFSNKTISIYELRLGSFSSPPALLASAGPTDRIMALFSSHSYPPWAFQSI